MRRHDPFDRKSLAASVGVHVGVLVLAIVSSVAARPPLQFVSYQIELVSPPPAAQAEEEAPAQEELVVERPDPEPEPPQPEEQQAPAVEQPKPKPPEPQPEKRNDPPPKEAEEEKKPATTTAAPPEEKPKESGAGVNVRMEGLRRDYPAYYANIITQIQRCFRWTQGGSWETTVYFVIKRDGSVSDQDFVRRSGNAAFDFEAMGAVECAGKGRFGALPDDLPFDLLPIQFKFQPQGGIRENPLQAAPIQNPNT